MRFRLGLFLGFLIGYVLGAQAGRQRYEQIRSWANQIMGSESAQRIQAEVRSAASQVGDTLEHRATEGVTDVTSMVREQAEDADT
jgi:diacylglycerol kinase family enzyme